MPTSPIASSTAALACSKTPLLKLGRRPVSAANPTPITNRPSQTTFTRRNLLETIELRPGTEQAHASGCEVALPGISHRDAAIGRPQLPSICDLDDRARKHRRHGPGPQPNGA